MKQYTNIFILIFISMFLSACDLTSSPQNVSETGQNPLLIPALIDSRTTPEIELVMQNGAHEFYSGVKSETMGFNGDYLGPTIRLYRDTDVTITFANTIEEPTTVHGHGLHVNGEIDGGPQSVIQPGESWQITLPVRQEAGTSWYHPHMMGKTAHHVHAGLAGFYLIEDENSQALDLPNEYGVNDIPLVIQDRSFTDGKMNGYFVTEQQIKNGLREDTLVVNGTIDAYHTVPEGWVRLRLLNGSNARFYRFSFADGATFYKIATEGGFLNQPVAMTSINMAPGERNEIMIDLSDKSGASLIVDLLRVDSEDGNLWDEDTPKALVVELRVDSTLQTSGTLPEILNDIAYYEREDDMQIRTISLDMEVRGGTKENMDLFGINGQSMDMSQINFNVNKGEIEIWQVTGERMPHPFHIHGVSFQILTLNGEPVSKADRGWKDTVVVWDEVTEIAVRFDYEAPEKFPFMVHCHMLEHEEYGMMWQFTVD